jgi:hypothetical protein
MKTLIILIILISQNLIFSQDFEGEIIYELKYYNAENGEEIKDPNLKELLGTKSILLVKDGYNKQSFNSTYMSKQIFSPKDDRFYFRNQQVNDTLYYHDLKKDSNTNFKLKTEKLTVKILGYTCKKTTYKDSLVSADYYFASELKSDPKYFKNYKIGNRNRIQEKMKSLCLRYDFYIENLIIRATAIVLNERKLTNKELELPNYKVLIEKKL